MDEIRDKPKQRGGAVKGARSHWIEGRSPKTASYKQERSDLAQKRDAITRDDVDQQIKNFFR